MSGRVKTTGETPVPCSGKIQRSTDVAPRSGGELSRVFDRRRREGAADTGEGVAFDEETFVVDDLRAAGHAGGGEQRVDWRGDHRCKTASEFALISGVANLGQGSAKRAGRRRGRRGGSRGSTG